MVSIGNIGGNEPIKEPKQNNGIQRNEVSSKHWTIFDSLDKNNDKVLNEKDGQGAISKFWSMITNIGKGEKTQNTKPTGTTEDVKNATNQPTTNNIDKFADNGTYISDIEVDSIGNKTIKAGNDTLYVAASGNQLKVTNTDGKSAELVKTDNGYEFKDEDGKLYKFDQDMNLLT